MRYSMSFEARCRARAMPNPDKYPLVVLGEVLIQDRQYVRQLEPCLYPKLSVKLYGRGVALDPPVDGGSVRMPRHQLAKAGQVILSEIWGKKGAIGIVPEEGSGALVTSHFYLFDIVPGRVDPGYLKWILRSNLLEDQLAGEARGTTGYAAVRPHHLLAARIPLPSLSEQRRIAARIEELAAKIEEARLLRRQARNSTDALIRSAISAIFRKGIERGWLRGRLGDYLRDARYGTSEKPTDLPSGVSILRMGNIQNGRLDLRALKYLDLSRQERAILQLAKGDILVNRTNSAELVGKCAVFELEGEYAFASYLIRLRLDTTRANPRLVAAYINSPAGRSYMFNERKQMTGQANVNATTLKAMPLALPTLPEQDRLLEYLDKLHAQADALGALQAGTAAALDCLVPSIVDKALEGRL